jgi:hypothetical protein
MHPTILKPFTRRCYVSPMATWSAVTKLALTLPGTTESKTKDGRLSWQVKTKTFAWERPLRRVDLEALGAKAPKGAILGIRVADLETKDAMLRSGIPAFFTTPHFDGYAAVLIELARVSAKDLKAALAEAWRCRAPKQLLREVDGATKSPRPSLKARRSS